MDALKQYLVPYIISNILFVLCLIAAVKKPMWARIFLATVFLWAAYTNFKTALSSPEVYLDYEKFTPVPFYREFINGIFSQHIKPFVFLIAMGEFFICIGLLLKNGLVKMSCLGGILFGLAISPLGIGSAFPATVLMALAFGILLKKERHDYIWKWRQYEQFHHNSLIE
jgi:hypothetical protein